MKSSNLLLAAVSVAFLASCAQEPSLDQQLQGSWQATNFHLSGWTNSPFGDVQFGVHEAVISAETYMDFSTDQVSYKYVYGATYQTPYEWFPIQVRDSLQTGLWRAVDGQGINVDSIYIDNGQWTTGYEILSFTGNEMLLRSRKLVHTQPLGYLEVIEEVRLQKQ